MTLQLKTLGPYRVDRAEYPSDHGDRSYSEIIRVKGSNPDPPGFLIPSHIYKYSESHLAIYLKDHKNAWRDLSRMLGQIIDITDEETIIVFPLSAFQDVAKVIPLVHKRGRSRGSLSPEEKVRAMRNLARKSSNKIDHIKPNLIQTLQEGNITLDTFGGA